MALGFPSWTLWLSWQFWYFPLQMEKWCRVPGELAKNLQDPAVVVLILGARPLASATGRSMSSDTSWCLSEELWSRLLSRQACTVHPACCMWPVAASCGSTLCGASGSAPPQDDFTCLSQTHLSPLVPSCSPSPGVLGLTRAGETVIATVQLWEVNQRWSSTSCQGGQEAPGLTEGLWCP